MAWDSVMFKARGSTVRAGTAAVCLVLRKRRDQYLSLECVYLNLITNIIAHSDNNKNHEHTGEGRLVLKQIPELHLFKILFNCPTQNVNSYSFF